MAIDNKDVSQDGKDTVKSQLSSAYEDGVTGFGEKIEPQHPQEGQFLLKSTDPTDPDGPTFTATSSTINKNRIQTIASMSIDAQELERIKEKLEVRTWEDTLNEAIVRSGLKENERTQAQKDYKSDRRDVARQANEYSFNLMGKVASLAYVLQQFENQTVKGTWIDVTDKTWNTNPELMRQWTNTPYKIGNYDRQYYSYLNGGETSDSYHIPVLDALYNIFNGSLSIEEIGEKTISALLLQSFYDAEIALDYGVSPNFMISSKGHILGDRTISTGSPGGGTGNTEFARHHHVNHFLHHGPMSDHSKFSPIGALMSTGGSGLGVSMGIPFGLPHVIKHPNSTGGFDYGNPSRNIPHKAMHGMDNVNRLIYLTSIVAREFQLSKGIATARRYVLSQHAGEGHFHGEHLKHILNGSVQRPVYQRNNENSTAFGTAIGSRVLGASRVTKPVYAMNRLDRNGLSSCLRTRVTGEGQGNQDVMFFEVTDPEMDAQDQINRVGNNFTLKSLLIDPTVSNPSSVSETMSSLLPITSKIATNYATHLEVLGQLTEVEVTDFIPNGGTACWTDTSSRQLLGQLFAEFGDLVGSAALWGNNNTGGGQSGLSHDDKIRRADFHDLVALSKCMKPSGKGDQNQIFFKKLFIKRMCGLDLVNTSFPDLSQHPNTQNPGDWLISLNANRPGPGYNKKFVDHVIEHFHRLNIQEGEYAHEPGKYYTDVWSCEAKETMEELVSCMIQIFRRQNGPNKKTAAGIASSADFAAVDPDDIKGSLGSYYPGSQDVVDAQRFMLSVFGDHNQIEMVSGRLAARIKAIADYFIMAPFAGQFVSSAAGNPIHGDLSQEMFVRASQSEGPITVHAGMDRAALLTYILEVFLTLADIFVDGEAVLGSAMSIMKPSWNSENTFDVGAQSAFLGNVHTFGAHDVQHYFRVIPKIEVQDASYKGSSSIKIMSLGTLSEILISYGSQIRSDNYFHSLRQQDLWDGVFKTSPSTLDKIKNHGNYIGDDVTLQEMFDLILTSAKETSAPTEALAPATALLTTFDMTLFAGLGWQGAAMTANQDNWIEQIQTAIDELPQKFKNFISSISLRQVFHGWNRLHHLDQATRGWQIFDSDDDAIGNRLDERTPFVSTNGNAHLDQAAMLLIDNIKSDGFRGKMIFFGVPRDLIRSRKLALASKKASVSLNDYNSLVFRVTFEKNSELSHFTKFTQNPDYHEEFVYDTNFFTSRWNIQKAIQKSGVSTWNDLVENVEFWGGENLSQSILSVAPLDAARTLSEITGQAERQAHTPSNEELRKRLENILKSELSQYIFERVTDLNITADTLHSRPGRIISRSGLLEMLKCLVRTNNENTMENFPFGCLSRDPEEIIDALFENDDSQDAQDTDLFDPIRLKQSEDELRSAFEPQLVREGTTAYFTDPIVTETDFYIVECICNCLYTCIDKYGNNTWDDIVFAPSEFDYVIGIIREDFDDNRSYDVSAPEFIGDSVPEELLEAQQLVQDEVREWKGMDPSESPPAGDMRAYFQQILNGGFRIDNYRPVFKITLD